MAGNITAGSTAKASDFINNSERDTTASNDAGRVAKLEDDGKLHPAFIGGLVADITVGEDIDGSTTPKACFIAPSPADTTENTLVNVGSATGYNNITVNQILGAVINVGDNNIITAMEWSQGYSDGMDSSDEVVFEVYAVDGSNLPTGSALASKTVLWSVYGGGTEKITLDSPVTLTKNTVYAFCIKNQANAGGEEFGPETRTNNPSSTFETEMVKYTGSWATVSGRYPAEFKLYGYPELTSGEAYKSDENITQRNNFDGFIVDNLSDSDDGFLYVDTVNKFTGLTAGSTYYVDSDGAIATTGTTEVGKALSDTTIKVKR